jgi:hypothetical protein
MEQDLDVSFEIDEGDKPCRPVGLPLLSLKKEVSGGGQLDSSVRLSSWLASTRGSAESQGDGQLGATSVQSAVSVQCTQG